MRVTLRYTIHSAAIEDAQVEAKVGEQTVMAMVPRLVVELVADDGDHGHTFRLPVVAADQLALQREAFQPGRAVTLSIDTGEAA